MSQTSDVTPTVATEPEDAPAAEGVAPVVDPTASPSDATSTDVSSPSTVASDPTPATDSVPVSPTSGDVPPEAPQVTPPAPVLPTGTVHDTREVQALIEAGKVEGLTNEARSAVTRIETVIGALEGWLTEARDALKVLRGL